MRKELFALRKELFVGLLSAIVLCPAAGLAQSPAQDGYVEGGRAAGPVGAVVGGAVGAAVELPSDVLGFVTGHPRRYERVREEVVIGRPLPRVVRIYPIPRYRDYAYAYVNERRVIVEPRTRRVIRIID
jgi:hypothetical protein